MKFSITCLMLSCCLLVGAGFIGCQNVEANNYEDGVSALEAGDYTMAMEQFRMAAEDGHAGAQAAIGELYNRGKGTERDAQEAAKWYRLAAEQGHVDAQVTLGWMYNAGTGVPQSNTEAFKWFRLAADQGHPGAQNNLGVLYRNMGKGPTDKTNAVAWFQKAADQGVAPAQYALGQMYLNGEGVEKSLAKAVQLYTEAANQGILEAQADLGFLYAAREDKVPQDFLIAYKWLSLATRKGDRIAKTDLAKLVATMTNDQIEEAKKLMKQEAS